MREGITVVGLGPGDPRQMTVEAWETLTKAPRVFARTRNHPAVQALIERGVPCESFDGLDDEALCKELMEAGEAVYAVPGDPLVRDRSVELLLAKGLAVRIVPAAFAGLVVSFNVGRLALAF